ncbi:HAD family hydrolase [Paenibacillus tengchongensis]|uniref:Cof-type HAD-IIB family hydrolase n=1 Tax=Paenibacillus tengchongensis TaxID=2608684 RepID=UPI00124EB957|nr:HAD family hydrolase [Paenibacillus tengchongensis]
MKLKAAVIDLDGTLLTSGKIITDRTAAALLAAKSSGLQLIFATARPPRAVALLQPDLRQLGSVVYYNGALYHCSVSKQSFHFPIHRELAGEIIGYCLQLNPEAALSIEVMDHWYSFRPLDYTKTIQAKEPPAVLESAKINEYDCTKILLADFSHADRLYEKYDGQLHIVVTDDGALVQIMAGGVSKEAAVRQLCVNLGIEMKDVMCFGDDFNDLGLFGECGYPVAMGNAAPQLKQAACEITDTNDLDGVAQVLERWLSADAPQFTGKKVGS